VLLGGMALWEDAGEQLCDWFAPALEWIQRWMALFYSPFLVALPANAASLIGERHGGCGLDAHVRPTSGRTSCCIDKDWDSQSACLRCHTLQGRSCHRSCCCWREGSRSAWPQLGKWSR
jgi:hypothetical protein